MAYDPVPSINKYMDTVTRTPAPARISRFPQNPTEPFAPAPKYPDFNLAELKKGAFPRILDHGAPLMLLEVSKRVFGRSIDTEAQVDFLQSKRGGIGGLFNHGVLMGFLGVKSGGLNYKDPIGVVPPYDEPASETTTKTPPKPPQMPPSAIDSFPVNASSFHQPTSYLNSV